MSIHLVRPTSPSRLGASWRIGVCLLLLGVLWLSTSSDLPITHAASLSPLELLDRNGTLKATVNTTGTVYLEGWNVHLDPERGPILTPKVPTSSTWAVQKN